MKKIQKIASFLMLTGSFVIGSSLTMLAQDTTPGVFVTAQDYLQHKLTACSELSLGRGGFKGVLNGKKIRTQYKDAGFWGIEDAKGVVYRINKKANIADRIISSGKVFYYAGMELVIEKNENGTVKTMDIKAENGVKFSDIFWISDGADGDMIGASNENLSKLIADSPDLVSKVQKMDETTEDNWVDTYTDIAAIIGTYDKAANK